MTGNELRHMSRADLVEVIYEYQSREQDLLSKIEELTAQLEDRRIHIDNAGSIAEAALSLNHIFEAAQAAADQYLGEVRKATPAEEQEARSIIADAETQAARIRQQAQSDYMAMLNRAKAECDAMYAKITQLLSGHNELRILLPGQQNKR